jgi:hypothetical protein
MQLGWEMSGDFPICATEMEEVYKLIAFIQRTLKTQPQILKVNYTADKSVFACRV